MACAGTSFRQGRDECATPMRCCGALDSDQPIATPEQAESWAFWLVVLAAILFVLVLVLSASDFHFAR